MGKTDSAELEGTQDSQSKGSNNKSGQQGSEPEYVTVEQFKEIQKTLDLVSRQLQSNKDRAVKHTNERLGGVDERLDGVEKDLKQVLQLAAKDGKSVNDLLSEVESQEEADFRKTMKLIAESFKNGNPQANSFGSEKAKGVDVSEVLKELELDSNDVRVKDFANRTFESREQALLEGVKLVKTIISRQPSDADKPSGTSDRAKAANKQEALQAEYDEGSKKLHGQALINFKMEMRKKGLQIF
jgi:hypothetical protein